MTNAKDMNKLTMASRERLMIDARDWASDKLPAFLSAIGSALAGPITMAPTNTATAAPTATTPVGIHFMFVSSSVVLGTSTAFNCRPNYISIAPFSNWPCPLNEVLRQLTLPEVGRRFAQ